LCFDGNGHYDWQNTKYVLSLFGQNLSKARNLYSEFVYKGIGLGKRPELTGGGLIRSQGGWKAVKALRGATARIKGDERILGDSDFIKEVLEKNQQQLERRYHYHSMGYDFDWLVSRVATLLGIEKSIVTRAGSYPGTVEARSILCYWAAREFGISTLELSKRLGVSQPTASQSVKRGEKSVKEKKHSIV
jgi:putative transposase